MKKIALYTAFLLSMSNLFALTPNEQKLVQQIQASVRAGKAANTQLTDSLAKADARASAAEATAKSTQDALGVLQGQIRDLTTERDNLKKDVAKMKPVYDECTKGWGTGAIIFGLKDLGKHIFWTVVIGGGALLALYIASFFVGPLGLAFHAVFNVLGLFFRAIGGVLKLIPRPKAPQVAPKPQES